MRRDVFVVTLTCKGISVLLVVNFGFLFLYWTFVAINIAFGFVD